MRQEDLEFKASLGYTENPRIAWTTPQDSQKTEQKSLCWIPIAPGMKAQAPAPRRRAIDYHNAPPPTTVQNTAIQDQAPGWTAPHQMLTGTRY